MQLGISSGQGPLRRINEESWKRSLRLHANPDMPPSSVLLDGEALEEYRRGHPLASIMPVINKLLIQPSSDQGLLVAVGDELGRLLWVDGDAALRRRAEGMMFVEGADWSEASVGTSAPGTALALALDRGCPRGSGEAAARLSPPARFTRVVQYADSRCGCNRGESALHLRPS